MAETFPGSTRQAVLVFHFADRIKAEILLASRLLGTVSHLEGLEQEGASRLFLDYLQGLEQEINLAPDPDRRPGDGAGKNGADRSFGHGRLSHVPGNAVPLHLDDQRHGHLRPAVDGIPGQRKDTLGAPEPHLSPKSLQSQLANG